MGVIGWDGSILTEEGGGQWERAVPEEKIAKRITFEMLIHKISNKKQFIVQLSIMQYDYIGQSLVLTIRYTVNDPSLPSLPTSQAKGENGLAKGEHE